MAQENVGTLIRVFAGRTCLHLAKASCNASSAFLLFISACAAVSACQAENASTAHSPFLFASPPGISREHSRRRSS